MLKQSRKKGTYYNFVKIPFTLYLLLAQFAAACRIYDSSLTIANLYYGWSAPPADYAS